LRSLPRLHLLSGRGLGSTLGRGGRGRGPAALGLGNGPGSLAVGKAVGLRPWASWLECFYFIFIFILLRKHSELISDQLIVRSEKLEN
jgi:hypothetical protein